MKLDNLIANEVVVVVVVVEWTGSAIVKIDSGTTPTQIIRCSQYVDHCDRVAFIPSSILTIALHISSTAILNTFNVFRDCMTA